MMSGRMESVFSLMVMSDVSDEQSCQVGFLAQQLQTQTIAQA